VNDATRILGATLGVAVIGSIYASLYASQLTATLTVHIPDAVARTARRSVGEGFGAAALLQAGGHADPGQALHDAAADAFFHGFEAACLVAAAVSGAGAILAVLLIPSQPPRECIGEVELKHVQLARAAAE
jgi:hypothetical protein